MVLAVNPPLSGDQTAAAFKEKAMASTGSTPAAPASDTSSASATGSGSGGAGPSQTSGNASPSDTNAAQPTGNSNGAVSTRAKIELGFAAVVAFVGVMVAV